MTWSLCVSTWEWWMSFKAARLIFQECLQKETCVCPSVFTRVLWKSMKKAPRLQQLIQWKFRLAALPLFQCSVQTIPSFSSSGTTKPIASCSVAGSPLHRGPGTMWGNNYLFSISTALTALWGWRMRDTKSQDEGTFLPCQSHLTMTAFISPSPNFHRCPLWSHRTMECFGFCYGNNKEGKLIPQDSL